LGLKHLHEAGWCSIIGFCSLNTFAEGVLLAVPDKYPKQQRYDERIAISKSILHDAKNNAPLARASADSGGEKFFLT
jgi:hypothetical protein